MSELVPGKKIIPVQAQRVDPDPTHMLIPTHEQIPLSEEVAGGNRRPAVVTQNIHIHVNQPVPPPVAPPVVVEKAAPLSWSARPKRLGRGTSILGMLGLLLGAIAIASNYVPQAAQYVKQMSLIGAALAALGLLFAVLFSRAGSGVPILGLMVCAFAYFAWLNSTGKMPPQVLAVKSKIMEKINAAVSTPPAVTTPPAAVPPTITPTGQTKTAPVAGSSPAAPAPSNAPSPDDHTIFGDGGPGWTKANTPTNAAPASPGQNAPAAQVTPPARSATPPQSPAVPKVTQPSHDEAVATAKTNLESARLAAARRLNLDYATAKSEYDAASTEYEQAKTLYATGGPELADARQQFQAADTKLNNIIIRLNMDPAVTAAKNALKALQTTAR